MHIQCIDIQLPSQVKSLFLIRLNYHTSISAIRLVNILSNFHHIMQGNTPQQEHIFNDKFSGWGHPAGCNEICSQSLDIAQSECSFSINEQSLPLQQNVSALSQRQLKYKFNNNFIIKLPSRSTERDS